MSGSDGEHSLRKSSTASRTPSLSPLPSLSLTRDHITEALAKSPDGGATLDLAYKGLTDVGESGAEELAFAGQDEANESDSAVVRYVLRCPRECSVFMHTPQNCTRTQPAYNAPYGVLSVVTSTISGIKE